MGGWRLRSCRKSRRLGGRTGEVLTLEGHPGGTWGSQGTAASALSASRATSPAGHGHTPEYPGPVRLITVIFSCFLSICVIQSSLLTTPMCEALGGELGWREHQKKSLTLPTCGAGPRDSREGQELAC